MNEYNLKVCFFIYFYLQSKVLEITHNTFAFFACASKHHSYFHPKKPKKLVELYSLLARGIKINPQPIFVCNDSCLKS